MPSPEVELKLALDPNEVECLRRLDMVRAIRAIGRRHTDTYFDTADLSLAARNLHLRIRQTGPRFAQTLKTATAGGSIVQTRNEWNVRVPSLQPDLSAFRAPEVTVALGDVTNSDLRPLFTISNGRQTRVLTIANAGGGNSRVALMLDRGTIIHSGGEVPICEVELELIDGPLVGLYSGALSLAAALSVRIAPLSKADRGYMLVTPWRPSYKDAVRASLNERMMIGDAMSAVFGASLESFTANEPAVIEGGAPEGIHKMRVALRRLRSALSLFRKAMDPISRRTMNEDARWALKSLGDVREWDVFLSETLREVETARPGDPDLVQLRALAEVKRRAGYVVAREMLLSPKYCAFVLELGRWIEARGWRAELPLDMSLGPLSDFAQRTLTKRFKAVRKLGRNLTKLSSEERHQLRIEIKKLRYAVDFLGGLYPDADLAGYQLRLSQIQDTLGRMNDVAVMEARLSALVADVRETDSSALDRAIGKVIGWHAHGAVQDEVALTKHWKRVVKAHPFWIS